MMRARILVIEDDDNVLQTIRSILELEGYKVYTSSTGSDAFSMIAKANPNLIILDIFLGDLDGRIICQSVKRNPNTSHIPIIIMSGAPDIYNSIQNVGANDVVLKPFDEATLLTRVQRQLYA